MANVRTRKDVLKMNDWDPILVWYAKAVAELQTRPIADPTSWRYQAAIHEYRRAQDPLAQNSDVLPSAAEQDRFWQQCQHASWFFLPWHRMYLGCFEQIIMAAVKKLGGPDDWALPYWDYSDVISTDAKRLPPAFRATNLPDGSVNSLRVVQRAPAANSGGEVADDADVDLSKCLTEPTFTSKTPGGAPGFGGPRTKFNHSGGPAGELERVPHGSMHDAVGGGGWMSFFFTAALDPIFWLHHCNIDRLWEVWLGRDPKHTNPAEAPWLTAVSFELHDATGAIVSMKPSQVVDTTASPLFYEYEDVIDPLGGSPAPLTTTPSIVSMEESFMPEMVGATDEPLTLQGESATTALALNEPTGPASFAAESESPTRVHLNIENITGEGYAGSYSVYVNVPPEEDPAEHQELFAGLLPMFGVSESTDPASDHPANGIQYSLDITEVAQRLQANDAWDPSEIRVTFVPKRRGGAPEAEELEAESAVAAPESVQIGRVSLYYS